jgi:DNA (cytosine-5)-methyltransferase 1
MATRNSGNSKRTTNKRSRKLQMVTRRHQVVVKNTTTNKCSVLKVGTFFSGIAAPEQSLKNIGVNHTNEFMCEIDKFSRQTYLENFEVKTVYEDITTIKMDELNDVDLIVGGSPCQSYSQQNKNRCGLEDLRGQLIYNYINSIKVKQPRYFIYENVKGMTTIDKGKTFKGILEIFEDLNYKIKWKVLNSKNYGVGQNRERLFVVGIRNDIEQNFEFPEPKPVSVCVRDIVDMVNDDVDFQDYKVNFKSNHTLVPHITKRTTDIKKIFVIPEIRYETDRRIQSMDGITPCILTGGAKHKFYDEKLDMFRYLTPKEVSVIQGFPLDFKFPVSNSKIYKQVGNSISVPVLERIMENLIPTEYFNTQVVEVKEVLEVKKSVEVEKVEKPKTLSLLKILKDKEGISTNVITKGINLIRKNTTDRTSIIIKDNIDRQQVRFAGNQYSIASNNNTVFAKDPLTTTKNLQNIDLSAKFGVSVAFSGSCGANAIISFDHLGRPFIGDLSATTQAYTSANLMTADCIITLSNGTESSQTLTITPETGYVR